MRGNKLWKYLDVIAGTVIVLLVRCFNVHRSATPPKAVQKILVIKLAALGDTILLVPSLKALRQQYPSSSVWMIGTSINEELISLFPQYVHRFISFQIGTSLKNPFYFFKFIHQVRNQHFDVVVDFEQWSFVTAIISVLAGSRFSIGIKIPGKVRHVNYCKSFERQPENHEAENMAALLSPLGIDSVPMQLEMPVQETALEQVKIILQNHGWKSNKQLIVVHPGCGSHGFPREWPLDSYRSLCRKLQSEYHPYFIFTGSGSEKRLTESLAQSFPNEHLVWKENNLQQLIALLRLSQLVISGNNGIMHLAAALQKPQIALHGPTNPKKWGPINSHAVVIQSSCPECPCLDLGYEYHRTDGYCMAQITVDEVYHAVIKMGLFKR